MHPAPSQSSTYAAPVLPSLKMPPRRPGHPRRQSQNQSHNNVPPTLKRSSSPFADAFNNQSQSEPLIQTHKRASTTQTQLKVKNSHRDNSTFVAPLLAANPVKASLVRTSATVVRTDSDIFDAEPDDFDTTFTVKMEDDQEDTEEVWDLEDAVDVKLDVEDAFNHFAADDHLEQHQQEYFDLDGDEENCQEELDVAQTENPTDSDEILYEDDEDEIVSAEPSQEQEPDSAVAMGQESNNTEIVHSEGDEDFAEYDQKVSPSKEPTPTPPPPLIQQTELKNGHTFFRASDGQALTHDLMLQSHESDSMIDINGKIQEFTLQLIQKLSDIASELQLPLFSLLHTPQNLLNLLFDRLFQSFQREVTSILVEAKQRASESLDSVTKKRCDAQQNARQLMMSGGVVGMMGLMSARPSVDFNHLNESESCVEDPERRMEETVEYPNEDSDVVESKVEDNDMTLEIEMEDLTH
ncbi:hypothetical protein BCR33DRAFT_854562 [Rhizoclosmatium globosum]|uniref:Uncharacterized protein n=1 Tax=Rhizoclosmatium globosum TaxID=329046 RepID=A0A1Y2BSS8_9FUNG|nr:hypothetical protein BCR33DRAFT_854562 [Rhizoclosmatium globosum]|eukprot:ORY37810.1 hypothetical protein BCR33DRAFT_854562 [Rhizoclosmatium globosum]